MAVAVAPEVIDGALSSTSFTSSETACWLLLPVASVATTLGAMAAANVPFYVITNALPVILIGISVADAIHIYSHFFEVQTQDPTKQRPDAIVETMLEMWRPISFTTLTTAAGFLGLYFAAYMPPFKYFGLFAALGVTIWRLRVGVCVPDVGQAGESVRNGIARERGS